MLVSGSPATLEAVRDELAASTSRSSSIISASRVSPTAWATWICGCPRSRQVGEGLRQAVECRHSLHAGRPVGHDAVCKALIAANPQRVVWALRGRIQARARTRPQASDLALHRQVDDGHVMNMLPTRASDAATRKLILVDNPARLYGF